MALYSYSYATSWDAAAASFVNFETTFSIPVLTSPLLIPRGSVVNETGDGYETVDGYRKVSLEQLGDPYGFSLFSELTTYVTAVHTSFEGEDTEIALRLLALSGSYEYWNSVAHLPILGQDFTFNPMDSRYVSDLKLRYTLINSYTPA